MRNLPALVLILLTAIAATLSLAAVTPASASMLMYGKTPSIGKVTDTFFAMSGTYTGSIDGDIVLDGKEYSISAATSVYVVGEGLREPGISVSNASLLLCGFERNGTDNVRMVVVRPDEQTLGGGRWRPAIPEGAIPSGANPNTGTLTDRTPE